MFVLVGTVLGLLVAGALAKIFADTDLFYAQVGVGTLGALIGLWLQLFFPSKRGPRP